MRKSLKTLVIDSATKYLYIGIFNDKDCLGRFYEAGHNDHSVKLMTEIERLFQENSIKVKDLDSIVIGIGPGSYTGLRIGVVIAKMFGWNNSIEVKTVSSLALIASSYDGSSLIIPEIDARRGNSFLGLYRNVGESLELVAEEQLTNLDDYKQSLADEYEVVSFGEPNMGKLFSSNLLTTIKDIHALNPNYLRLTEAERNLK